MGLVHDALGLPERKKGINSRNKGCLNERNLCKVLEAWTGQEFARTPASGGLRWFNAPDVIGDVICCNREFYFPFAVETKHYKIVTVESVLRQNSKVYTFWEQAERDGERAKKVPLLFLRENNMPSGSYYLFVNDAFAYYLFKHLNLKSVFLGVGIQGFMSTDFLKLSYSNIVQYASEI